MTLMSSSLTMRGSFGNDGASGFYRVLHDYEIARRQFVDPRHGQFYHPDEGWAWRDGDPEVFWLINSHRVPFNEAWQRLAYSMNPGMTKGNFRRLYDDHRAFMNYTGFWTEGSMWDAYVPHADYISGVDLNDPLPEWDKIRVCGGMTLRGTPDGGDVIVETLKYDQCPTLEWLMERPWLYFHAVTTHEKADGSPAIYAFPQNNGNRVLVPLVAINEVRYPLGALQAVDAIADPYRIYIQ
jgi:hypothetical protein